jgi:PAS domain S-box-containing protein
MSESLRLFVIEEDPEAALLIRRHLERAGHRVSPCRTGTDALLVLGHTPFDLVLLDLRLPDMSGLDFLHHLAREGISVPVLIVTRDTDAQTATRFLRAGALDYLIKDTALTFLGELPKRVSESVTRHRLEQRNRLLVQALESARDGIMITDLQGVILTVNQALESLTGYDRRELLGQTPRLLKSAIHPPEVFAQMWQTVRARRSWQGELTNRRKDGSLFQASMTISPIVDGQGRMTHFVGIQRDMTEHKQLERALLQAQKMQSIGTLAGGVAHEFNNLLAGINGYASLGLREPEAGPIVRDFLQHIVDLSERAALLTRQLLAFARKPTLTRQRRSMTDLVRNTADLVRRTLHHDIAVEVADEVGGQPVLLVEADINQLQQALINLALNARDATLARLTEGGLARESSIRFRLRRAVLAAEQAGFPQQVPPGDYVVIEVADQGIGMTSEVLNQAFDPFFTTKEVGQGTGLGLPMVFGIVQGHQGYLSIESAAGRGTCVSVYLPRAAAAAPCPSASAATDRAEEASPDAGPSSSILVVDDEAAVLDVMCRFLTIAGHRVCCTTGSQEALDHLSNGQSCDLVILDLMMPREDARATFQRLRQRRPCLPILLCTGLPQAEPVPELLRGGAVGLIRKPFHMGELWSAVKEALTPR